MKKLLIASVSGFALMGLAACSDTDETTTQSVPMEEEAPLTTEEEAIEPAEELPAEEGIIEEEPVEPVE